MFSIHSIKVGWKRKWAARRTVSVLGKNASWQFGAEWDRTDTGGASHRVIGWWESNLRAMAWQASLDKEITRWSMGWQAGRLGSSHVHGPEEGPSVILKLHATYIHTYRQVKHSHTWINNKQTNELETQDKHCNLEKDLGWGLEDGKRTDLCRNKLTVPWVYVYFSWKCRAEMFPWLCGLLNFVQNGGEGREWIPVCIAHTRVSIH